MTYPPQYTGSPQPMPLPPKRRKRWWVVGGVSALVVALFAVGYTGFVSPGFFVTKQPAYNSGNSATDTFADRLVRAMDKRDWPALKKMVCAEKVEIAEKAEEYFAESAGAQLSETRQADGDRYVVMIWIEWDRGGDTSHEAWDATVAIEHGDPCVAEAKTGRYDPDVPDSAMAAAEEFATDYFDVIKAGDVDAATEMYCGGESFATIDYLIKSGADLRSGKVREDSTTVIVEITGTMTYDGVSGVPIAGEAKVLPRKPDQWDDFCMGLIDYDQVS